jgi:hypothetical protein
MDIFLMPKTYNLLTKNVSPSNRRIGHKTLLWTVKLDTSAVLFKEVLANTLVSQSLKSMTLGLKILNAFAMVTVTAVLVWQGEAQVSLWNSPHQDDDICIRGQV